MRATSCSVILISNEIIMYTFLMMQVILTVYMYMDVYSRLYGMIQEESDIHLEGKGERRE